MSYKDWLKTTIGNMLKEKDESINLEVYEYSNALFKTGMKDCAIVINGLGGTTDADIEVIPIQLMCLSGGQYDEDGNKNTTYDIFYEVLKEFCKTYNLRTSTIDFNYYKHNYIQPLPINPLEMDSGTFRLNFVVSGNLTVTRNVEDIEKIFVIDDKGTEYEINFINATLSYFTTLSPSNKIGQNLTTNLVQFASYNLQIQMYNRMNPITNTMKAVLKGWAEPNCTFNIKIVFNRGDEMFLGNMICESLSLPSDRINPSILTCSLVKAD